MKPLSQIIEEREPEFIDYDENCTSVCDRASYDRMKQIAVELAKACDKVEEVKNSMDYGQPHDRVCYVIIRDALSKCRELLGEK